MCEVKQVLRVKQFKGKDLYNIGIEMDERKGTGNYEEVRTELNITYVGITEKNLYQEVKKKLKDRNIEYLKKEKTNMLNGIIFTSGNEFYEALGMNFKDSGRTYQTGDKKGQAVMIPDIKNKDNIPHQISYYFDSCMEFLKDEVGEENIILAQVHYDEDTPHLQAYFLPIVKEVKRKGYEKDHNGNVIKEKSLTKDGKETLVPKLLRDSNGKIIYEVIKGDFLNNDQFWKSRGGKNSYANLQDKFNKFITEKGFKLDRGNVGASVVHQEKLEYQIKELEAELDGIKQEINYSNKELADNKKTIDEIHKDNANELLNPKRGLVGYNSNDVEKIIDYSKDLEKKETIYNNEILQKDKLIEKLETENAHFKDNGELKKRNNIIKNQNKVIKEKDNKIDEQNLIIRSLENTVDKLKKSLEKWKNKFFEVIDKIFGKEVSKYEDDYFDYADDFLDDKEHIDKDKDKDDDFEMTM